MLLRENFSGYLLSSNTRMFNGKYLIVCNCHLMKRRRGKSGNAANIFISHTHTHTHKSRQQSQYACINVIKTI